MKISNEQLQVMAFNDDSDVVKFVARELLANRLEKENLGIYREIRPRFYPRFKVVFMDENKVCGYSTHTDRFSSFNRKNFDKNFTKL